ncbi:hypothetical protein SANA_28540 [Gottschalkiaceae bacterium SANA]|nr:hypothetical protein SANA_28540 [Gottschalkiaceae bacterium SANA]
MEKKISVIIPVYGTEKYLKKCINSVLNQSYRNIEIIIVNDCSPDDSQTIIDAYMDKHEQIKCVKLEKNGGLFHARLAGFDCASGDYIAFLDSDDYLAVDAYRSMIDKAESTQSDIVFGNIVIEWEADGRLETHTYNEPFFEKLEGRQIVERYLEQEGYTFFWYAVWNKIFSKELFDQARPYFDRITEHTIMAEDVAFCSVLLGMADRVTCVDYYSNFYLQSATSSTSRSTSQAKYIKNIKDMCRVMDFVEDFIFEYPGYAGVQDKFARFKEVFVLYWKSSISRAMFSKRKKKECRAILLKEAKLTTFPDHEREGARSLTYGVDRSFIYSQLAVFNPAYEETIEQIVSKATDSVVFPFDEILFHKNVIDDEAFLWLLKQSYKKQCPAESVEAYMALRKSFEGGEVTLSIDEIYYAMNNLETDASLCERLKHEEIILLKQLYSKRKSVKQLFDLALYLGKQIIIELEPYMSETIVKEILHENGYEGYHFICFDQDYRFFNHDESVMVYLQSTEKEEKPVYENHLIRMAYPKSMSVLRNKCELFDYLKKSKQIEESFFSNILNQACVLNAANLYFDNPFRPFDGKTDFNRDAYLIGLLPLAMFVMTVTRWAIDKEPYKEIYFDKSNHLMKAVFDQYLSLTSHEKTSKEVEFSHLQVGDVDQEKLLESALLAIKSGPRLQEMSTNKLYVYGDREDKGDQSDSLHLFLNKSFPTIVAYLLGSLDDKHFNYYSEKLIKDLMHQGVLDFTNRMSGIYGKDVMDMQVNHQSMSYPFEYLLKHSKFKDIGLFDYCSLYFEKNKGYEEISVFNYWMQVSLSKADIMSGKVDVGSRGFGYYPFLQNRSTVAKTLFFLFFDQETLFEKLYIRFGSNQRVYKLITVFERLLVKGKDEGGEASDENK